MSGLASWRGVAGAWAASLAALGLWLARTPDAVLRQQLEVLQYWWLEATVWAVVGLGLVLLRSMRSELTRRDGAAMAILAGAALSLTLFVAPRTNRIYYDEHIYQGIGQNLADTRHARMCNDGTVEYGRLQCWSGEYNKQPYGFPHLLSVAYRVVAVNERVAFGVNAAVTAAAPVLLYLLVVVMFADRTAAVFAGLVLAATPHQVIWGATAAAEPAAAATGILALLAAAWFGRTGALSALAAAVVATAWAAQFRTESILIVLPVALVIWQQRRSALASPAFWGLTLVGLLALSVHLGHMHAVRNESWGSPDARLALAYVPSNLAVNGAFYLGDERYPVVFTLAALAGAIAGGAGASRWPLIVYFFLNFGIGLLFYAGSYNYGADVRYSLMTYPPLSALAGLGLASMSRRISAVRSAGSGRLVVAAVLVGQTLLYTPLMRATTEEAWAARADVAFARSLAPSLQGDRYVLTHNPSMFHVWGVNAGQMSMVTGNPSHLEYLFQRYRGGVYLHWNFWCNVTDPAQRALCPQARDLKPTELVRETLVRDQRFALYRFVPTAQLEGGSAPVQTHGTGR